MARRKIESTSSFIDAPRYSGSCQINEAGDSSSIGAAGVCIQAGPVLTADSRICQMELGLEGKVAIMTGGSKGIGRATALALLNEGACVLICARGQQGLDDALTAAGHA